MAATLKDIVKNLQSNLKSIIKIGPKTTNVVGIDIGSYSIKGLKLQKKAGICEIVAMGIEDLGRKPSHNKVLEALKKVAGSLNLEGASINTSVSGQSVISRNIKLPRMTHEELKKAITFEAEKYIPFDMQEIILDYQIINEKLEDGKMEILLVAAKKDFINEHIAILKDANLEVSAIDIDPLALANCFEAGYPVEAKEKIAVLLNLGCKYTNITIIDNYTVRLVRDIPLGGDNITSAIMEHMSLDYDSAQKFKTQTIDKADEFLETYKLIFENLASQIRLSFDYFENLYGKQIDLVYISGGTAKLTGIDKFLNQVLGIKVITWDTLKGCQISDATLLSKANAVSTHLGVAVGAALRDII